MGLGKLISQISEPLRVFNTESDADKIKRTEAEYGPLDPLVRNWLMSGKKLSTENMLKYLTPIPEQNRGPKQDPFARLRQ